MAHHKQKSTLTPSVKYRFDQSHSSNAGHPIKFSTTDDGTHNSGAAFTTGINSVGVPGQAGAYTEITVEQDSPILYYYCQNHSGMGARAYAATSGGASGGGASASTGDMTGYYVVASPPENIIFKPTYTVMPTDFTVIGTFRVLLAQTLRCIYLMLQRLRRMAHTLQRIHLSRQDTYFISCFISLMERLSQWLITQLFMVLVKHRLQVRLDQAQTIHLEHLANYFTSEIYRGLSWLPEHLLLLLRAKAA